MTFLIQLDQIVGFHPLTATLPGLWAEDSEELARLAADIAERGLDHPLILVHTNDGYVVADGRNRYRAAMRCGALEVEAKEIEESEVADVILHTLLDRRHLTKGALAYISYPVVVNRAMPNGGNRKAQSTQSTVVEELANQLGFSRDLFFQARQVWEKFAKRPDLRERFEPLIVAGEMGLGACLAGIAGMEATVGKERKDRPVDQLILAGFKEIKTRFAKWDTLPEPARAKVLDSFTETLFELPDDVQSGLFKALAAKHA